MLPLTASSQASASTSQVFLHSVTEDMLKLNKHSLSNVDIGRSKLRTTHGAFKSQRRILPITLDASRQCTSLALFGPNRCSRTEASGMLHFDIQTPTASPGSLGILQCRRISLEARQGAKTYIQAVKAHTDAMILNNTFDATH